MDSELQTALRDPDCHPERILTLLERSGYDSVVTNTRSSLYDSTKARNIASANVGDVVVDKKSGRLFVVGASQRRQGRVLVRTGEVTFCSSYPRVVLLDGTRLQLELPESWRHAALRARFEKDLSDHANGRGCVNVECGYRKRLEEKIDKHITKFGEAIPC